MKDDDLDPDKIYEASKVLNLGEKATMSEIKESYRRLIKKWHPDKCKQNSDICKAKTEEIINAYRIILKYCHYQKYSFKKEDIISNLPIEKQMDEDWKNRFGNDPLWG